MKFLYCKVKCKLEIEKLSFPLILNHDKPPFDHLFNIVTQHLIFYKSSPLLKIIFVHFDALGI